MSDDTSKKRILVLCTGNRCRSQMAEGWLRYLGGDAVEVRSAGTQPKGVHPKAIAVMAETGVDIGNQRSEHVDVYRDEPFDVVVTVCDSAREACPTFPGAKRLVHHSFEDPDHPNDPNEDPDAVFHRVRDQIRDWARDFLSELGVTSTAA